MMIRCPASLTLLCVLAAYACAQEPSAQKTNDKAELTEGLLDLLKEPLPPKPPKVDDSRPKDSAIAPKMDGEDIGSGAGRRLAEVQQGMKTLAEWMRSKSDVDRTRQLQRDVVVRLDEMIGQLEQQSSANSSAHQSSSSQPSNQTTKGSNDQASPNQGSPNQPAGNAQTSSSSPTRDGEGSHNENPMNESGKANKQANSRIGPNRPDKDQPQPGDGDAQSEGQPGVSPIRPRSVTVDLNDPRALQRSAWGSLPERVREQMQSRMVERFLPSYRDEIEAYYRALVK